MCANSALCRLVPVEDGGNSLNVAFLEICQEMNLPLLYLTCLSHHSSLFEVPSAKPKKGHSCQTYLEKLSADVCTLVDCLRHNVDIPRVLLRNGKRDCATLESSQVSTDVVMDEPTSAETPCIYAWTTAIKNTANCTLTT